MRHLIYKELNIFSFTLEPQEVFIGSSKLIPLKTLAPSSRVIALLARRRAALVQTMALVESSKKSSYPPLEEKKHMQDPPAVVTTPCDPWPRPYYLENGLRRVAPYHFTYNTFCKQRWRGRELLDIFSSEFRDRPLEYYVSLDYRKIYTMANDHRKML
jgi:hypothetical protein